MFAITHDKDTRCLLKYYLCKGFSSNQTTFVFKPFFVRSLNCGQGFYTPVDFDISQCQKYKVLRCTQILYVHIHVIMTHVILQCCNLCRMCQINFFLFYLIWEHDALYRQSHQVIILIQEKKVSKNQEPLKCCCSKYFCVYQENIVGNLLFLRSS